MSGLIGVLAAFAAVGLAIGATLGGGSEPALLVGLATPPVGAGAAIAAWRGIVSTWFVGGLARNALRSGGDEERFREDTKRSFARIRESGAGALPGAWVILPISGLTALVGGALMAFVGGPLAALMLFVAAAIQGVVLRRLARTGGLLLPE